MSKVSDFTNTALKMAKKHSPEILMGVGIGSFIFGTIMMAPATIKAKTKLDKTKGELEKEKLTAFETVKAAWPYYIPTFIVDSLAIACLIGSGTTSFKRNAALTAAYTLSENKLKDYSAKVIEKLGEDEEKEIKKAVVEEKVQQNPVKDVILTDKGETICFDVLSGRYFKSDKNVIDEAVNKLNREMRSEMYVTLNDFYYEIGLDGILLGDILGWNIDDGYIDIDYQSHLDKHGTPCLVLDYIVPPIYAKM